MIRGAILFVVVGLIAAGLLYERVDAPVSQQVIVEEASIVTPSVSDPARLDGAWFCPIGSSSAEGFADHEVRISNLSDEPAVANIAHQTGGQTFTAVTPQALHVVFDRIDRMRKVEIRSEKPQVIDFFDPFLVPALALLGLQLLAGLGLRFTPW